MPLRYIFTSEFAWPCVVVPVRGTFKAVPLMDAPGEPPQLLLLAENSQTEDFYPGLRPGAIYHAQEVVSLHPHGLWVSINGKRSYLTMLPASFSRKLSCLSHASDVICFC